MTFPPFSFTSLLVLLLVLTSPHGLLLLVGVSLRPAGVGRRLAFVAVQECGHDDQDGSKEEDAAERRRHHHEDKARDHGPTLEQRLTWWAQSPAAGSRRSAWTE